MLIRRYGRIVNVVSLSGLKLAGQTNYSAAKSRYYQSYKHWHKR